MFNINDFEHIAYSTIISCRDLGEHLHKEAKAAIRQVSEKELDALQLIADNVHFNAYQRTFKTSSSGLTPEECSICLSQKGMQQINKKFGTRISEKIHRFF